MGCRVAKRRISIKIFFFLLFSVILSIGDSLCFKANAGVVPYEAIALTLNYITGIKIGTLSFGVNASMILLQVIVKQRGDLRLLLQIPLVIVISAMINAIVYTYLDWVSYAYVVRLALMILGLVISAIGVGLLVALDVVVMPCEGVAAACSKSLSADFAKVRQIMDVLFIVLCVGLSLVLKLPFAIREGTVIAAVIYAPIMGLVIKLAKPKLDHMFA